MSIRTFVLCFFCVLGCGTSGRHAAPSSGAIFKQAPWSSMTDADGKLVFVQEQAGRQFPVRAGDLELNDVHVYDAQRNDVGFFYRGAFLHSEPMCVYGLSAYVYPATETLAQHLEAIRAEIRRANPLVIPTARVLSLDQEHGGTGVHAGFLNSANGVESFEAVSIYERAGWFIKYRLTMAPAGNPACEQRVRAAVADLQWRKS